MAASQVRSYKIRVFETPLKRPLVTAAGGKATSVNVGLTLTLKSGAQGYGEASTSLAMAHLKPKFIEATIRKLAARSPGRDVLEPRPLVDEAWERAGICFPAAAAFEAAVLEAACADRGTTLHEWFGGATRAAETDVTISAVDAASSGQAAAQAAAEGFRVLKIKVGTGPSEDLERVKACRRAAPRASFILDGNQGLTVRSALSLVEKTQALGAKVEMLEQPLPLDQLGELAKLVKRCPVPVVLDESVKNPQQALRAVEAGAAGGINIKSAKSGYLRSLEIAAIARAAKLPLMMGCMTETAKGLQASVQLALGTGWFTWLDLDSDHLLARNEPADWSRSGPKIALKA